MANKSLKSVSLASIEKIKNSSFYVESTDTQEYVDDKPTGRYVCTTLRVMTQAEGEIKVILPYRPGLADELNATFGFAQKIDLSSLGTITDIRISIYNQALTIKIFLEMN
ncbi:MAG: hypothetical protein LUI14_07925 [Lachnospiraceae bacterium]|nr:hypothetical protein [Lachnospiraceae bacterium]